MLSLQYSVASTCFTVDAAAVYDEREHVVEVRFATIHPGRMIF